ISLLLAVIMSVIAWRVAGEERRRSEARVAALAADIHDSAREDADFDLRRQFEAPIAPSSPGSTGLFASSNTAHTGPRLATVVGVGVLVFGSAAALAVMLGTGSSATTTAHGASL